MSRYLVDQIQRDPNVDVVLHSQVRELQGHDGVLDAVVVEDNHSHEPRTIEAKMMFVFIGAKPYTAWLGHHVALDDGGFILTGRQAPVAADGSRPARADESDRDPLVLETSLPGVFAAGDVRHGSIKRVASAVGEGSMAVRLVHEVLDGTSQHVGPAQTNVSSK
jgi:thioredoxin reductase (NADPH)